MNNQSLEVINNRLLIFDDSSILLENILCLLLPTTYQSSLGIRVELDVQHAGLETRRERLPLLLWLIRQEIRLNQSGFSRLADTFGRFPFNLFSMFARNKKLTFLVLRIIYYPVIIIMFFPPVLRKIVTICQRRVLVLSCTSWLFRLLVPRKCSNWHIEAFLILVCLSLWFILIFLIPVGTWVVFK